MREVLIGAVCHGHPVAVTTSNPDVAVSLTRYLGGLISPETFERIVAAIDPTLIHGVHEIVKACSGIAS